MDEVPNSRLVPQSSICSDSNGEDNPQSGYATPPTSAYHRICLLGVLAQDLALCSVAHTFGVPVVTSVDGKEFADGASTTIFVLDSFESDSYKYLHNSKKQAILGPTALQQLAKTSGILPKNIRPLYNLAMTGVILVFTGFKEKAELGPLVSLVHHMGASIRKELSSRVTHLIAKCCGGDKYQYAITFRLPVMHCEWVFDAWKNKSDADFSATKDEFITKHKLKPFYGLKVCFYGFAEEEEKHMTEILLANGGTVTNLEDNHCTHVVVDEASVEKPEVNQKVFVVKSEWFWLSVQKEFCLNEKDYLYDDYVELMSPTNRRESHQTTPSSASRRKRKRLPETLLSLATYQHSPSIHKRRSSVSDAGLLSVSGSFLDCTTSPDSKALVDGTVSSSTIAEPVVDTPRKALTKRQQVFLELVQTETNYVDILHTIMTMFKKHLEEMPEEEALLNNTELNLIFGKVPPIYETHVKMLNDLRYLSVHWSEEHSIGNIILRLSTELLKAYPPFINYFEEMKEVLQKCDQNKPRFHAFLKACQTKPECGRQSLQDLIIRPVQRLGSISLLLNDILKNTPKTNPDHAALDQALAALREVMTHINEDKRKAEGQVILFNIFNEIDNCPPDIVSSHRSFITKTEVIQRQSLHCEVLSNRGNNLMLFLFSDQLEICKKKSKSFNSLKSPTNVTGSGTLSSGATTSNTLQRSSLSKPFKHIKLIPLNTIKYVIDVKETEQCRKIFSLVFNDETKDKIYSFAMIDDVTDKTVFLKTLTRQMANYACTPDADKFILYVDGNQLELESNDINNGTLSKAFKFASRTKFKVGRAFSFNKTPSKLKRAVSSMMSPFGSSTNITPSNQLAQMRLASYSNINELGNAENATDTAAVIAPMSVQPTRKMKTASLNENALKRL